MKLFGARAFSGGVNNKIDPSNIQDNEFQDGINVRINLDGSAEKRTGWVAGLNTPESSPILAYDQVNVGQNLFTVFATKSDIKLVTNGIASTLFSGLNGIDYGMFHQWNDKLFFANGIDNIKKTNIVSSLYIYTVESGKINQYTNAGVFNQTLNIAGLGTIVDISSDSLFLYVCDSTNNKVQKVALTGCEIGVIVASCSITGPLACKYNNDGYLYAVNSGNIYKIITSSMTVSTSVAHSSGRNYCFGVYGAYLYIYNSIQYMGNFNLIDKINTSDLSLVNTTWVSPFAGACNFIVANGLYVYLSHDRIYQFLASDFDGTTYPSSKPGISYSGYPDPYNPGGYISVSSINSYGNFIIDNFFNIYGNSPLTLLNRLNNTVVGASVIYPDPINEIVTEWYDLCSPYKPIPNLLSDAGNINATVSYRSTWFGISDPSYYYQFAISSSVVSAGDVYSNNGHTFKVLVTGTFTSLLMAGTGVPLASGTLTFVSGSGSSPATITFSAYSVKTVNASVNLETSGGLESIQVAPSGNKVEVFFDFNLSTMLTADKAWGIDTNGNQTGLGVTHHRVYRKEGSNAYLLQGTYPIYFNADLTVANIGATDITFAVLDAKGFTMNGTQTPSMPNAFDNCYLLFSDTGEIVELASVSGNVFGVLRGAKGTTPTAHTDTTSPIYMFSIIDNIATASLGQVCPTLNQFAPIAKYMTDNEQRMFYANTNDTPSRLWFTSLRTDTLQGDEDLLLVNNWYGVSEDDGEQINGIRVYMNNIQIWKDRSLYYLTGTQLELGGGSIIRFSDSIGCVADKSIVEYSGGLFFLSRDGIIFLSGQRMDNLSYMNITPTINSINWAQVHLAHAIYYQNRNEYWLSVPVNGSLTNNLVIVVQVLLTVIVAKTRIVGRGQEYKYKCLYFFDHAMSASRRLVDQTNADIVIGADYSGNMMLLDNGTSDNNSNINSFLKTKNENFGMFDWTKKYRRIITDFLRQGNWNLSVQYSIDGGSYLPTSPHLINMAGSGRDHDKWGIDGSGQQMNVYYSDNSMNPWKVFNWMLHYKTVKLR